MKAAALLLGLAAVAAAQEAPGPAPAEVDATAIARRADAVLRSDRTFLEATLRVSSPGQGSPREVGFRSWNDRSRRWNVNSPSARIAWFWRYGRKCVRSWLIPNGWPWWASAGFS